ncbi:hypothetical protein BDN67DRAFT_502993 [Paxillus ammoniavirescens]|nr:hypothetical protein BDN67DRAFT_502993 [Paxillus ammoniavirescens]
MDCCGKCLDYFCVGPRADRERFRPWKKKSRAVLEAEKQAKKEKRKGKGRKHRKTKAANSQNAVTHPPHHLDPQCDGIEAVSPTSPATDEADLQPLNLHLQAQVEQLRRQLDDSKREARAERDRVDENMEESPYNGHESGQPQGRQLPTGSSIAQPGHSSHAEPSRSDSYTGASTHQDGLSTSSNAPPDGHPSGSTQFNLGSLQAEEHAKNAKRENAFNHVTNNANQSPNTVHAQDFHSSDSQKDDVTTASVASPAADEVNVQRAILQLQEQFEQLRRRLDDPKREAEEKEGLKKHAEQLEYDGRESHRSRYPIPVHSPFKLASRRPLMTLLTVVPAPRNITWTHCRLRSEGMKRGREPP